MYCDKLNIKGEFEIVCRDKYGRLKWKEKIFNSTMDDAINDLFTTQFRSGTQKANWYLGLKGSSQSVQITWNSAGIGTQFTEYTNYSESVRQTWTTAAVSSKTITNNASPATFTINGAGGTVYGAFIISNNTKTGTTGILWCCSNLAVPRSVVATDVVTVVYAVSGQTG